MRSTRSRSSRCRNCAPVAYIATGLSFPDALAGGAAAAKAGGPLLLVRPDLILSFGKRRKGA